MAYQIKTNWNESNKLPIRWLSADDEGYYTTDQSKAKTFATKAEADSALEDVKKTSPAVPFEVVEVP